MGNRQATPGNVALRRNNRALVPAERLVYDEQKIVCPVLGSPQAVLQLPLMPVAAPFGPPLPPAPFYPPGPVWQRAPAQLWNCGATYEPDAIVDKGAGSLRAQRQLALVMDRQPMTGAVKPVRSGRGSTTAEFSTDEKLGKEAAAGGGCKQPKAGRLFKFTTNLHPHLADALPKTRAESHSVYRGEDVPDCCRKLSSTSMKQQRQQQQQQQQQLQIENEPEEQKLVVTTDAQTIMERNARLLAEAEKMEKCHFSGGDSCAASSAVFTPSDEEYATPARQSYQLSPVAEQRQPCFNCATSDGELETTLKYVDDDGLLVQCDQARGPGSIGSGRDTLTGGEMHSEIDFSWIADLENRLDRNPETLNRLRKHSPSIADCCRPDNDKLCKKASSYTEDPYSDTVLAGWYMQNGHQRLNGSLSSGDQSSDSGLRKEFITSTPVKEFPMLNGNVNEKKWTPAERIVAQKHLLLANSNNANQMPVVESQRSFRMWTPTIEERIPVYIPEPDYD
ncbi:hypothetical protein T11_9134 [Trichinella zimbabwensis]|uniref:Uncharacterized protein n=1 Tax=Trichinella zimbabwensis TaxID=268475 RepID=A0A0V1HYF4_9BILA|nr:hypothetical protein T11_9134 [Trichinella zimbabwensis]